MDIITYAASKKYTDNHIGRPTDAQLANYFAENPVKPGASASEVAQIEANADAIEHLVAVTSSEAEVDENTRLWIDPSGGDDIKIPTIQDMIVSKDDTWSSSKIKDTILKAVTLADEVTGEKYRLGIRNGELYWYKI